MELLLGEHTIAGHSQPGQSYLDTRYRTSTLTTHSAHVPIRKNRVCTHDLSVRPDEAIAFTLALSSIRAITLRKQATVYRLSYLSIRLTDIVYSRSSEAI